MLACFQEQDAVEGTEDVDDTEGVGIDHPKHISEQRVSNKTVLKLDISDPLITKNGEYLNWISPSPSHH